VPVPDGKQPLTRRRPQNDKRFPMLATDGRAQSNSTENQVWPEADVYVTLNPQTRFLYTLRGEAAPGGGSGGIANGFYLEYFLPRFHPVFFREIIKINDARIQRIVLEFGERLIVSVNAHPSIFEKPTLAQATA
jgi:hypothetical protein